MDPEIRLTPGESRLLGVLVEKALPSPELYPLTLNAIVNGANQKNNRDPVMALDEESVSQALASLQQRRMAGPASSADSRVTKYEHRLQEVFNFDRREIALICVLLLRGPQTPGELRGRSERMYRFETLEDVQSALQRLMDREPPLVRVLARQPGTKESRYMHLFAGDKGLPPEPEIASEPTRVAMTSDHARISALEDALAGLRQEVAELRRQFSEFRDEFKWTQFMQPLASHLPPERPCLGTAFHPDNNRF